MFSFTKSLILAFVISQLQVTLALPIHYQSSFDMTSFHVSTPVSLFTLTSHRDIVLPTLLYRIRSLHFTPCHVVLYLWRSHTVSTTLSMLCLSYVVIKTPLHLQHILTLFPQDTLHQCTPALFAWTPTSGPYYLSVKTSSSTAHTDEDGEDDAEVVIIPHATSASWIVDVLEGQQVVVEVKDSEGRVAETLTRRVRAGPSHCL